MMSLHMNHTVIIHTCNKGEEDQLFLQVAELQFNTESFRADLCYSIDCSHIKPTWCSG